MFAHEAWWVWLYTCFIVDAISIIVPPGQEDFTWKQLQAVVVFIGHGSTGSSLVGSLLDAHPKVVITNEYNLLSKLNDSNGTDYTAEQIYFALYNLSKTQAKHRSSGGGYSYTISGQWQGEVQGKAPLLIGDKKAGRSSNRGLEHLTQKLRRLTAITKLPLKLIYVGRNPYDSIATRAVKRMSKHNSTLEQSYFNEVEHGTTTPINMSEFTCNYLSVARTVQDVMDLLEKDPTYFGRRAEIVDINYEDLVRYPSTTLLRICAQLGILCTADYIKAAVDLIWPTYHYTRLSVDWSQKNICEILRESLAIRHLQRYMLGFTVLSPHSEPFCRNQCFPGASPCPCNNKTQNCIVTIPA